MSPTAAPGESHFDLTVLREEDAEAAREDLRSDVRAGLTSFPKSLPSKYFYDDAGSEGLVARPPHGVLIKCVVSLTGGFSAFVSFLVELYARITESDEYYPTRTEAAILTAHAPDVAAVVREAAGGGEVNVVELGAGDGRKTKLLLRELVSTEIKFRYVPVDISRGAMAELFTSLSSEFKGEGFSTHGIVGEYAEALAHVSKTWPDGRTVVLFLGSSIGNFTRDSAIDFMSDVRSVLRPGDILFAGFDLKKDPEMLRKAYSDADGITREFNLNLLRRLNREAEGTFDVNEYQHLALYNPVRGAMESYLLSRKDQCVSVAGEQVFFDAGEPILTEYSYKYLPKEALSMAKKAGFSPLRAFYDTNMWFLDALLTAS